jgi:predicted secreted protein
MALVTGSSSSQGTQFKKATGTAVANLNSIDGLDVKANTIDSTTLDTAGGFKTFVQGFKEVSDVALSGYYSPKDHDIFMADLTAGDVIEYEIVFPIFAGALTPAKWVFDGIVTGFKHAAAVDNIITFDATIKVVGQPTFTPAA